MRNGLYQVFDKVSGLVLGPIMAFGHDAPAVRMFTDALRDPGSGLSKHPDDYVLLQIGEQNPDGELVDNGMCPRTVVTGSIVMTMVDTSEEVANA